MPERATREPVEWGIATRRRPGEARERRPGGRRPLARGRRSSRRSTASGTGSRRPSAARKAGEVVRESPSPDLVLMAERCHRALRDTRGAAISLALVSPVKSAMTWLGVGSVEGRVVSGDPSATRLKGSLALGNGVPGHQLPGVRTATVDVLPGDVLVLATDGIEARFGDSLDISGSTQAISDRILADHWQAHRRRPRRDRPLPRPPAVIAGGGSGAVPFRAAYASALREYLHDAERRVASNRVRARARGSGPTAQRARPGRRPPGGPAVLAGRRPGLGRRTTRDARGR